MAVSRTALARASAASDPGAVRTGSASTADALSSVSLDARTAGSDDPDDFDDPDDGDDGKWRDDSDAACDNEGGTLSRSAAPAVNTPGRAGGCEVLDTSWEELPESWPDVGLRDWLEECAEESGSGRGTFGGVFSLMT
jgi:hypothetical protein